MDNTREITVSSDVESLEQVLVFVNSVLLNLNCEEHVINQIDIALDELFANISGYAYEGKTGEVTIRMEIIHDPLSAVIEFRDGGMPFDPLKMPDPDVTLKAGERRIGGLGIFMVKSTMDDMSYEYKDGKNIVRIRKVLSVAEDIGDHSDDES